MILVQCMVGGQKFRKKSLVNQLKIPHNFLDFFNNRLSSISMTQLSGGANNQLVKVASAEQTFVIKKYRPITYGHDRFFHEETFYHWIQDQKITVTPHAFAWNKESRLGLFSYIEGSFPSEPISDKQIEQVSDFVLRLNMDRDKAQKLNIPVATDTARSIAGHLENVSNRLSALTERVDQSSKLKEIQSFLKKEMLPRWESIYQDSQHSDLIDYEISKFDRVLSPSDIGFHNTLESESDKLTFYDFEYAGWDDPCKMCCDFSLQPRYTISSNQSALFENKVSSLLSSKAQEKFFLRLKLLKPIHCIKWCCIFFNELAQKGFKEKKNHPTGKSLVLDDIDQQIEKAQKYLSLNFN